MNVAVTLGIIKLCWTCWVRDMYVLPSQELAAMPLLQRREQLGARAVIGRPFVSLYADVSENLRRLRHIYICLLLFTLNYLSCCVLAVRIVLCTSLSVFGYSKMYLLNIWKYWIWSIEILQNKLQVAIRQLLRFSYRQS